MRFTEFGEAPIVVRYFRFDSRDEQLWPTGATSGDGVDALLDAATTHWRRHPPPVADATAAAEVGRLCEQARKAMAAKDLELAQELLSGALAANRVVHSPLPCQFAANVATMTGDLWTAVAAQKEALRLAPHTLLYRSNLRVLLTVPYKKFARRETRDAGE